MIRVENWNLFKEPFQNLEFIFDQTFELDFSKNIEPQFEQGSLKRTDSIINSRFWSELRTRTNSRFWSELRTRTNSRSWSELRTRTNSRFWSELRTRTNSRFWSDFWSDFLKNLLIKFSSKIFKFYVEIEDWNFENRRRGVFSKVSKKWFSKNF